MRIERLDGPGHQIKVYDEDDKLVAFGHEEILSLPDHPTGFVRSVPIMFVLDQSLAAAEEKAPNPWDEPSYKPGEDHDDLSRPARPA